jgi:hypothetical protein
MGDAVNAASRLEGFREVDRIKHYELKLSNRTLRAYRVRVAAFGGK